MISWLYMNTLLFLIMKHPLSCGLTLLIQTILTALMSGMMNLNFWYSYILFLIMVGGLLILFIYMTSVASNEKFLLGSKVLLSILLGSLISFSAYYYSYLLYYYFFNSQEMTMMPLNFNNNYSLMKYFNLPSLWIMIMMIIYLFITLIAVVKITNNTYGPLRQKF
nr:NADH dehydrogenase subunit 6 [Psylliodes attenuatus]